MDVRFKQRNPEPQFGTIRASTCYRVGLLFRRIPLSRRNYWRFDITDNFEFTSHKTEKIILPGFYRNELYQGDSALSDENGFTSRLNIVEHSKAMGFQDGVGYFSHNHPLVSIVISGQPKSTVRSDCATAARNVRRLRRRRCRRRGKAPQFPSSDCAAAIRTAE
jgi:hypothetical protein